MRRTSLLLVLIGFTGLSLGCPDPLVRACTEIGCSNGFSLTLNHSTWSPGTYRFDVEIDTQEYSCSVTLPFSSCDTPNPCNSNKVSLGLSGCALPADQHGISSVTTPVVDFSQMRLKISSGNSVLLERIFTPHFQTLQPNGPGCEPICRNASDIVQF